VGQKVNPIGFRISVSKDWRSRWFANKSNFGELLHEDLKIRDFVLKQLSQAAVSRVQIERFANRVRITVHSARPGLVFGRKRSEYDSLKDKLFKMTNGKDIYIDVIEIQKPELDAQLIAENVALQMERRIAFRRAMKKGIQTAMDMGALGIKIRCGGRLGGAELARTEEYKEGKTPLHTLRADVRYGFAEANTNAGKIGVKAWVCQPEAVEGDQDGANAKTGKVPKGAAGAARRKRVQKQ
jgi:small subunit ribosomal protein S3